MTCTDPGAHPNAVACSARAYCRAVDSVCSRTCANDDCRTYTNATRSRCDRLILVGIIATLTATSQHRLGHVRQHAHRLVPPRERGEHSGGGHLSTRLSPNRLCKSQHNGLYVPST